MDLRTTGVIRKVDEKNSLSVKDIVDQAVSDAKADAEFAYAEKKCPLDYDIYPCSCEVKEINTNNFSAVGYVNYGGSEGIYGEIYFMGIWNDQLSDLMRRNTMGVYTLKTLDCNKEAYLGMGMMVNLICYYINERIGQVFSQHAKGAMR